MSPPNPNPHDAAAAPADDAVRDDDAVRADAAARADDAAADDARAYVRELAAARGYVLPFHRVMAANDFPALEGFNAVVKATYLAQRSLSRATKELIFIVTLTAARASAEHIASHIRVALAEGVTPTEILEAMELLIPEVGVVIFQHGFDVWRACTKPPEISESSLASTTSEE